MLHPPPEQPEWIKALILAPPSDSAPPEFPPPPVVLPPIKAEPVAVPPMAVKTPKGKPKPEEAKAFGLLGKRSFNRPPPGRSTGIISFIGPTYGHIQREDLEKFTFSFDVFFGARTAMIPGVRVHFTACKEANNSTIATDVKVAPGGTENVSMEIYEAFVSQPIVEPQPGKRQYPGQVFTTLGGLLTNLSFERRDSSVTLLKDDRVLLNLLTDIVTNKRRATNIRPQIPDTFGHTKETRLKGVLVSLNDSDGVLRCEEHGELSFDTRENFSEVEFCSDDINEEVEFTVIELLAGKRAIRIQRVKEPLLFTLCSSKDENKKVPKEEEEEDEKEEEESSTATVAKPPQPLELYEGVVTQPILAPTGELAGFPGQIYANIGPLRTSVSFQRSDCGVTLLRNDHVLINLQESDTAGTRKAANIRPKVPFTFSYTGETRTVGVITSLNTRDGVVKSDLHGELPFDISENFSDSEFTSSDVNKEVEFTMATVKSEKRAIRLLRRTPEDLILQGQKRREEEEKKREEEERKKKEEVTAALAAAQNKWSPLGFSVSDPRSVYNISRERFNGTVLKTLSKTPRKKQEVKQKVKEEVEEEEERVGDAPQVSDRVDVKIKEEKMDEDGGQLVTVKLEKEQEELKEEVKEVEPKKEADNETASADCEMGRLVMTINGEQKHLNFTSEDLISSATMMEGDRVRFNVGTHKVTQEECAKFVEILLESFDETIEQRRNGIVIEFSNSWGLIKCSQSPQLFFHMCEVLEKKKLELNEKVEFSVVPHETAEGGLQAIRIRRYVENVFLPNRKLSGVGAGKGKGKMTIKLNKPAEEAQKGKPESDKLKAVVKNLRAQDSKHSRKDYASTRRRRSRSRSRSRTRSRSRSKTRSRSRSPIRDKFGRILKKRRSSPERRRHQHSRERSRRRSRSRSRSPSRSRSKNRSRSKSVEKSPSRSRSTERSKEEEARKWSKTRNSKEREDSHKRHQEPSLPPSQRRGVDEELARKKRELDELNEMIAYKKSLVDPGQSTCIDYNHGRNTVPVRDYKPVRSILKKRPEAPEYGHPPYDDPYHSRPYAAYEDRRYEDQCRDPYGGRPQPDRPYGNRPYDDLPYDDRPYVNRPYESGVYNEPHREDCYTDHYKVYEQPFKESFYNPGYVERPYDPYNPNKESHPPERHSVSDASPSEQSPPVSTKPSAASSSSQLSIRPQSPIDSPPRSPSPTPAFTASAQSPPSERPPLDRFLDMLNKKSVPERKLEPDCVTDDLLPHERAVLDGKGFSRIVGLAQESPSVSREVKSPSPKRTSVERTSEDANSEPYEKIQSLLRTIGLNLSSGEVTKLASRAQEKIYNQKASSSEREAYSPQKEDARFNRTGSLETDSIHSPSPVRSTSLEPLSRLNTGLSEYDGFLDQQELETLKMATQLQSFTKTMRTTTSNIPSPKPPPGPPPTHYVRPPLPLNWPISITPDGPTTQTPSANTVETTVPPPVPQPQPAPLPGPPPRHHGLLPPGPPPGPPPRRATGQPPFLSPSSSPLFPLLGQRVALSPSSGMPSTTAAAVPLPPSADEESSISTTMVRCLKVIETVKSLAAQPAPKVGKSVQFSLPSEDSSILVATESEDAIRAKQKEKLDQYQQRLLEKREQQQQERLARIKQGEKNVDFSLGKPLGEVKNVWICGHSLVYWAESRAKSPEVGMQLGMDPARVAVWWKGTQGMTWSQLLPQLHQLKVTWPNPDVLIVHLGGNDLSTDSPTNLLASVRKDLTSVRSVFPNCALVWSNILPRRAWRHSSDPHEMDLVRSTVNRRIQSIVAELGGASLSHDNIRCGANTGLYRSDGVHLSPKGLDLFNLNLQDFLEKWDLEVNGAS